MRRFALLTPLALGLSGLPLAGLAAAAPAVPATSAVLPPPPDAARAAAVRAGVDAWTAGNYEAAVKAWQGPAAKNDPDALFNLGQAYKLGRGVPKDPVKAEAYYGKAARLGHIAAADNYGVLLFQTNRQQAAMPWLQSAADRGEPRAMYVIGIAAYNGDFAPKDWVRAYALVTRAAAAGLPQATASLATMNQTIPLAQRQMGASLAIELEQKAADARGRELAAADLGGQGAPLPPVSAPVLAPVSTSPAPKSGPGAIETIDLPPSTKSERVAAYLPPPSEPSAPPPPRPVPVKTVTPKPAPPKPIPAKPVLAKAAPVTAVATGAYRIQLGAFGVKANADGLWARLRSRPEITGHARQDVPGTVLRLLATGYSQNSAERACAALKAGGFACLVVAP